MKISEIKELISVLDESGYNYLKIKKDSFMIELSKEGYVAKGSSSIPVSNSQQMELSIQDNKEITKETVIEEVKDDSVFIVKSPIVGTFYEAANPEADPFVKKGDIVKEGNTLCIIEAMKLMNEIDSEVEGEVIEVLVKNESPVEYGQPLFKIKL